MSFEDYFSNFANSPAGKGVAGRSQVHKLASADFRAALTIARQIEHAWYRCQSLAMIAEANPKHPQAEAWLEEALAAAYSQVEPNRVASVSSWPLKILCVLNPKAAGRHAAELLKIIGREPHGLRRLHGISGILQGVATLEGLREQALQAFAATAGQCVGWRSDRCVSGISLVIAPIDRSAAIQLLESRPNNRFTRHARGQLLLSRGESGKGT